MCHLLLSHPALQGLFLIQPWCVSGTLVWPDMSALIFQPPGVGHAISGICIRDISGWNQHGIGCDIALV